MHWHTNGYRIPTHEQIRGAGGNIGDAHNGEVSYFLGMGSGEAGLSQFHFYYPRPRLIQRVIGRDGLRPNSKIGRARGEFCPWAYCELCAKEGEKLRRRARA